MPAAIPDSTFIGSEVSSWATLIGSDTAGALTDLGLNSDYSASDSSDQAKRNRNRAKAILALMSMG